MEAIKRRNLRLELLENVETKEVPGLENDVMGYEVYYGRSVDGEPSRDLKQEEVTNYLLTGLSDAAGLHIVSQCGSPQDVGNVLNQFVLHMRHTAMEALSTKFGLGVTSVPQAPAPYTTKRKVLVTKEASDKESIADDIEGIPEWNKDLLRQALRSTNTRDA